MTEQEMLDLLNKEFPEYAPQPYGGIVAEWYKVDHPSTIELLEVITKLLEHIDLQKSKD